MPNRHAVDCPFLAPLQPAEAHSTKALETAIAVDPLFTKTGAQFDEGGAKGARSHVSPHVCLFIRPPQTWKHRRQPLTRPSDTAPPAGLLMHNLSVHRGCNVVFDSDEARRTAPPLPMRRSCRPQPVPLTRGASAGSRPMKRPLSPSR